MGIGVSIFLIALGAILTFATNVALSGLDLNVVGVILMVVGAVGLLTTLLIWGPRRRAARVERQVVAQPPSVQPRPDVAPPRRQVVREDQVIEERPVYDDRPPL